MFKNSTFLKHLMNGDFDAAIEYRASFIPDFIYKFVSLSETKDTPEEALKLNEDKLKTLANNKAWAARFSEQNDPYEFAGMYIDRDKLTMVGYTSDDLTYLDFAVDLIKKSMYIIAFTDNMGSNLPMWAHYANNHRGFCVKYSVGNKKAIRNVIYEPKRIPIERFIVGFLQSCKKDVSAEKLKEIEFYASILQEMYCIKHESWKPEREYRLIYPTDEPDKSKSGFEVALDEVDLSVSEIYSGIKCETNYQEQLDKIADSLDVQHYRCKMSSTDYTVYE